MNPLHSVAEWDVAHRVVTVLSLRGQLIQSEGPVDHVFRLASVSKLLTAYAVMVGVEEGAIALDDPAGPPGSTLRHLLSHASGLGTEAHDPVRAVADRRVYSNVGIELAAAHLEEHTGIDFGTYLHEAVLEPLAMTNTSLTGSCAHGVTSTAADLRTFLTELCSPRLLAAETLAEMTTVQYPGLAGIVPGVGRFERCDWGLGFERVFGQPGHWAGPSMSPSAYGHFGAAGTFVWVDPAAKLACLCLTDRDFGPWALTAWPRLCSDVMSSYGCDGSITRPDRRPNP